MLIGSHFTSTSSFLRASLTDNVGETIYWLAAPTNQRERQANAAQRALKCLGPKRLQWAESCVWMSSSRESISRWFADDTAKWISGKQIDVFMRRTRQRCLRRRASKALLMSGAAGAAGNLSWKGKWMLNLLTEGNIWSWVIPAPCKSHRIRCVSSSAACVCVCVFACALQSLASVCQVSGEGLN